MGGAVRNIPNAPNLEEFEAEIQLGISQTNGAGGLNNKTTGVFNIPLIEDQLALRVAAYRYENQGHIDMVSADDPAKVAAAAAFGAEVVNRKGIGDSDFSGLRASILWQFTENLSSNSYVPKPRFRSRRYAIYRFDYWWL